MTSPEILALVERYDSLNANERAALLDWVRTIPLRYGAWQPFKRLTKTLDKRALNANSEFSTDDVELLAALAARLDVAPIPSAQPRLQPIEIPTQKFSGQSVHWNGLTFEVSGRSSYDWNGWRLTAKQRTSTSADSWQNRFAAVRRALHLPTKGQTIQADAASQAGEILAVWDFDARTYIGRVDNIALSENILRVKGAYASRGEDIFDVDISDPAFPHLVTATPRPETWQYMKRRVRRLLRELSHHQPARYWTIFTALLHESARLQADGALDPARQWALMWALHGNGARWVQKPAGRGAYRLQAGALPWQRTRREESAPEIWSAHLAEMGALASDENVPLQANLVALQVLAAAQQAPPELPFAQALRFLNGDALWLKALATRAIGARWLAGENVAGALAAATILQAGAPLRRQLQPLLETVLQTADAKWRGEFMAQALQTLKFNPRHRRARMAANYLAEFGRDAISDDDLFAHLNLWLDLNEQAASWALERVREAGAKGEPNRLDAIVSLPAVQRERALAAFLERAGESNPTKEQAWQQVSRDDSARNELGWRYLEATGIKPKTLRELWLQLLDGWHNADIFAPAFGTAAAANLFARASWQPQDVTNWFKNYYSAWSKMQPHLSLDFARAVMSFVPENEIAARIFAALPNLKAESAPQIAEAFLDRARNFSPGAPEIRNSILSPGVTWPYTPPASEAIAAAWRFLEASSVTDVVLQEVWQQLFAPDIVKENVAPAIALLRRANLSAEQIEKWLQSSPELAATFAPNFFGALFSLSSGTGKVALAVGATPEQWRAARPLLLQILDDAALRVAFWEGIWEQLRGESSENLPERLLGDREILATFALLNNATMAEMMATNEDAHTALLERWLDAHQSELQRDDVALIAAATCPLPPIRERGLARVRELGLDLPLALRLIESTLPPTMELAQEWFRETENGSEAETERAIALCDSPQAEVRAWGRDFVARRADTLLNAALLEKLSEGGDAQNQAFVAQQLQETDAKFDTAEFDSAVFEKSRPRASRQKCGAKSFGAGSRNADKRDGFTGIGAWPRAARPRMGAATIGAFSTKWRGNRGRGIGVARRVKCAASTCSAFSGHEINNSALQVLAVCLQPEIITKVLCVSLSVAQIHNLMPNHRPHRKTWTRRAKVWVQAIPKKPCVC